MFDKDNKFGFISNNENNNNLDIKKYIDDNTVIQPLPVHTIQETAYAVIKVVNVMDLIEGVQYSTHKDTNETRQQSYRIAYVCDDGSFKLIRSLPLKNKVVHLLKVVHSTKDNYSTLSYNNMAYKVDYTKHSTNTDVEVTETLQNYLPIANITEYTPTKDYHPATKKYVDDRFICTDIIENVGIITKEEMQKCNNGTSRYVSSINFKEFFADYKYTVYQGTYGDKNILIKYDAQYNRMLTDVLDTVDKYNITLGFNLDNNYMYPFSGGASQVKSYQFTNDLVITKSAILNPSEVYSKGLREYVGTKENPVLFTEIKNGWNIVKNYYKWYAEYENSIPCGTMLVHKCPAGKNFYITYMNGAELTRYGYNATTHVIKGYNHVLSNEVLNKYENNEYTPTNDYNPATKKYVDDKVEQILPEANISANDVLGRNKNGELIWKEIPNLTCLQSLDKTKPTILSELSSGIYYIFGYAKILRNSTSEIIDYQNYYGLTYINGYTIENMKYMTIDTHIRKLGETLPVFYYITFNKDLTGEPTIEKRLYPTSDKILEKNNTQEYTPTENYHPSTKKYVDDSLSNILSFNESGELVVTINGVSKTFVPKSE